ncbi:MAG: MBL fold metallo-hydrolase [Spirochaetota bacterium]
MKISGYVFSLLFLMTASPAFPQAAPESDVFPLSKGKLTLYFIGHGTLRFDYNGTVIHIDPVSNYTDYSKQPKADIILITHEHGDHLDLKAISAVSKDGTQIVCNKASYDKISKGKILENGQSFSTSGITVEAVPAYNTTSGRDRFHPKGRDNGYILTIEGKRLYIAGDTEDVPEMKNLKNIDIAFLPMNQPYTMTPEQVAEAVKMFHPAILYPYHYGDTDVSKLSALLKTIPGTELRIRNLK